MDDCNAPMVISFMGEDAVHFRGKSKGAHKFPVCIRKEIKGA